MISFKKGQKVIIEVHFMGVTKETGRVSRVTKKGIYLDNGPGNDETGPFDLKTHILELPPFGYQKIKPVGVVK